MAETNCSECKMREKYDQNPKSLIGRFWRWHIKFCPGWKSYFSSISDEEKDNLSTKYKLR